MRPARCWPARRAAQRVPPVLAPGHRPQFSASNRAHGAVGPHLERSFRRCRHRAGCRDAAYDVGHPSAHHRLPPFFSRPGHPPPTMARWYEQIWTARRRPARTGRYRPWPCWPPALPYVLRPVPNPRPRRPPPPRSAPHGPCRALHPRAGVLARATGGFACATATRRDPFAWQRDRPRGGGGRPPPFWRCGHQDAHVWPTTPEGTCRARPCTWSLRPRCLHRFSNPAAVSAGVCHCRGAVLRASTATICTRAAPCRAASAGPPGWRSSPAGSPCQHLLSRRDACCPPPSLAATCTVARCVRLLSGWFCTPVGDPRQERGLAGTRPPTCWLRNPDRCLHASHAAVTPAQAQHKRRIEKNSDAAVNPLVALRNTRRYRRLRSIAFLWSPPPAPH